MLHNVKYFVFIERLSAGPARPATTPTGIWIATNWVNGPTGQTRARCEMEDAPARYTVSRPAHCGCADLRWRDLYSRWSSNRRAVQERAANETKQARRTVDALGGEGLKILSFYATPGAIKRGDHTTLCYGVSGAKTVRLEPPAEEVWPALTRCIRASPRQDTEYRLIAEDAAGHSAMESVTVKIR